MNTLMKKLSGALALSLLLTGGAQAAPTTLADLLQGGSLTVGDKTFDNWSFVPTGSSDGRNIDPSKIVVSTLADDGSGYGLDFNVLDGLLTVTGDDIYAYVDLALGFHVSVTDPGQRIVGASLGYNPAGAFYSYQVDGSTDVGSFGCEYFAAYDPTHTCDLSIQFSVLNDVGTSRIADSAAFAAVSDLWVTKNFLVWAVDATDSAGIWGFYQRFQQTAVPEPGTLALLSLGLLVLGLGRRRSI